MIRTIFSTRALLCCLLAGLATAGCSEEQETPPQGPIPVNTITARGQTLPNIIELPGRVEPVRVAEVRARVDGIVQRRMYDEGTDVEAGQALFLIDPSELQASYAQVEASLQRERARAANAKAVVERFRPLVNEQAISRQEFDAALAADREAQASVAQISAQLDAAALQLGYTTVKAPIAGRAGRARVTEGALVSGAQATLLTRVEQVDPVYVTFAQSSSRIMEVRRGIAEGTIDFDENGQTEVRLFFEDGSSYPLSGYINFLDFSVEESTGTVTVRAEFPNPNQQLLPGEFVRAQVFVGTRRNVITVPQGAVQVTESGATVLVVDEQGNAMSKRVELGPMADDLWLIESGLNEGDAVIVSNLQKVRPGAPVQIVAAEPAASDSGPR